MKNFKVEEFGKARIMAFSKTGMNHLKNMVCNQDSYAYVYAASGNCALALADGVSSCINAKQGSETACKIVCEMMHDVQGKTENEIKEILFKEWKKCIKANWNDFGTTLNFCYLFDKSIVLGKIGDGAVLSKTGGSFYGLIDDTPFYSAETFAFGESIPRKSFSVKTINLTGNDSVSVLLMTDGVCKEIESERMKFFADYVFLQNNRGDFEAELEQWISELDKKNGDDKTLLVCTWRA